MLDRRFAPCDAQRMKNESVPECELARLMNNLIGIVHFRITSDAPRLVLLCTQAVRTNQGRLLLAMLMREIDVLHTFLLRIKKIPCHAIQRIRWSHLLRVSALAD